MSDDEAPAVEPEKSIVARIKEQAPMWIARLVVCGIATGCWVGYQDLQTLKHDLADVQYRLDQAESLGGRRLGEVAAEVAQHALRLERVDAWLAMVRSSIDAAVQNLDDPRRRRGGRLR